MKLIEDKIQKFAAEISPTLHKEIKLSEQRLQESFQSILDRIMVTEAEINEKTKLIDQMKTEMSKEVKKTKVNLEDRLKTMEDI